MHYFVTCFYYIFITHSYFYKYIYHIFLRHSYIFIIHVPQLETFIHIFNTSYVFSIHYYVFLIHFYILISLGPVLSWTKNTNKTQEISNLVG
jgi:hypothetical protein